MGSRRWFSPRGASPPRASARLLLLGTCPVPREARPGRRGAQQEALGCPARTVTPRAGVPSRRVTPPPPSPARAVRLAGRRTSSPTPPGSRRRSPWSRLGAPPGGTAGARRCWPSWRRWSATWRGRARGGSATAWTAPSSRSASSPCRPVRGTGRGDRGPGCGRGGGRGLGRWRGRWGPLGTAAWGRCAYCGDPRKDGSPQVRKSSCSVLPYVPRMGRWRGKA